MLYKYWWLQIYMVNYDPEIASVFILIYTLIYPPN